MLLSILEILIGISLIFLLGVLICAFAFFVFETIQDIKDEMSRKKITSTPGFKSAIFV